MGIDQQMKTEFTCTIQWMAVNQLVNAIFRKRHPWGKQCNKQKKNHSLVATKHGHRSSTFMKKGV